MKADPPNGVSRRTAIAMAGGAAIATSIPLAAHQLVQGGPSPAGPADLTGQVARYMASAAVQPLPHAVVEAARDRILDTVAAMISEAR